MRPFTLFSNGESLLIDLKYSSSFERANLTLLWDVTPYVGVLQAGQSNQGSQFTLPSFSAQQK